MSAKENEALIRRVYDEYNKGNYDVYDEYFADDFISIRHDGSKMDKVSYKQFLTGRILRNYPDIQRTIDDLIVTDDRAALYFTWTGTDNAQIQGRPAPTGNKLKVKELYFIRFQDGKISEYRQYGEVYGMMLQMGGLIDRRPLEENKQVVRQFQERLDRGDVSAYDELMTNNCVFHAMDMGIDSHKEDYKQRQGSRALTEQTISIEDMIAEDDKVFARCVRKARHTGQSGLFPDIHPTGKETSVSHFVLYRLEEGKIAEAWTLMNWLGLFQQIGALPTTEEIGK